MTATNPAHVRPDTAAVAVAHADLPPNDAGAGHRQQLLAGKAAPLIQQSVPRSPAPAEVPEATRSVAELAAGRYEYPPKHTPAAHRNPAYRRPSLVKESTRVSLEYDPATRRKVLNTYEILRDIGRGEHGKVKLAKNLTDNELVAIKIVSRKGKDRRLRMRRASAVGPQQQQLPANAYEARIRREIAIMKRCDHRNIVRFKEVLDDHALLKIYLVLEYMDRGEIKWKRPSPAPSPRPAECELSEHIPCWAGPRRPSGQAHLAALAAEDNDLLSNEFSPNLSFRQSRRVFRDVLLGLEYLHMQGIVHRDIKPANLLVNSEYTVKISDFGVSFASSLGSTDDSVYFTDMELAKTVGTPAFFAPELCQTSIADASLSGDSSPPARSPDLNGPAAQKYSQSLPKVDHKIDIWALGVTLYCLLFGRVPFNAESEFALFNVIVNEKLQFPESRESFCSPQEVSEKEFELAKDLLRKMLDKNSRRRIDIEEIKQHAFVLLDLKEDTEKLDEFLFFNTESAYISADYSDHGSKSRPENHSPTLGIAKRNGGNTLKACNNDGGLSIPSGPEMITDDDPYCSSTVKQVEQRDFESDQGCGEVVTSAAIKYGKTDKSPPSSPAAEGSNSVSPNVVNGSMLTQFAPLSTANSPFQPTRKSSVVIGNALLQDVIEFGSAIRRDSVGSQEAPQIETKRNVGGDLYMQTQSAVEAFKDIQRSDKKRRKSSIFASLSRSSSVSVTGKQHNSQDDQTSPTNDKAKVPITSQGSLSRIKVGPISTDPNRRPSSVISFPLTESFASLDSFNDVYLTSKYQEFKKKKQAMKLLNEHATQSDSVLEKRSDNSHGMHEKFKNFNLGSLMANESRSSNVRAGTDHDEVEPRAAKKTFINLHMPSDSDSCSSDSSCSLSSNSENEEKGNLTLKFPSKVAPRLRPPFLTLGNRALSHESNLTELAQLPKNHYYPYLFQELLHELEDVPESLMGAQSISSLPEVRSESGVIREYPVIVGSPPSRNQFLKSKIAHSNPAHSSPLRTEIVGASERPIEDVMMHAVDLDVHLSRKASEIRNCTIERGYFNNHYKKEQVRAPVPLSKHLDTDKESTSKSVSKSSIGAHVRPIYNRSNSITLGLLQQEPSN